MSTPVVSQVGEAFGGFLHADVKPTVDHLVTEDDTPVDNIFAEKQERLLVYPLYSSWPGPGEPLNYMALANVGLFYAQDQPAVVPDFLLSLGVRVRDDLSQKRNRSYFIWEYGKFPELIVEVVSNNVGGELTDKKALYARLGIPLYVVWDPFNLISKSRLQAFILQVRTYESISPDWLPQVGLGITVWHGSFEGVETDWLRWRDREGNLLLTGDERAEQERLRAEQESLRAKRAEERAERLAEQLRKLGGDPAAND